MIKYSKDEVVTALVTGIEPYGIFVSLDDSYDGLIHISEISADFVRNVSDYANIGEKIKVKIIEINEKTHHVKLSIKDLDYRLESDTKIKETVHGFDTLKERLNYWVDEKIKELTEKK